MKGIPYPGRCRVCNITILSLPLTWGAACQVMLAHLLGQCTLCCNGAQQMLDLTILQNWSQFSTNSGSTPDIQFLHSETGTSAFWSPISGHPKLPSQLALPAPECPVLLSEILKTPYSVPSTVPRGIRSSQTYSLEPTWCSNISLRNLLFPFFLIYRSRDWKSTVA